LPQVAFTVDVEQDAPPFLSTWHGVEAGLPSLLELLSKHGVPATFFVTGQTAERYPGLIADISSGHEVSCHGYEHERFDRLVIEEQRRRIDTATELLKAVTGRRPPGFRAPNFRLTWQTLAILEQSGYTYDASRARYKRFPAQRDSSLTVIPNTLPSSVLRLPTWLSRQILRACLRLLPLVVLDYHPWELVEMSDVRFDLRHGTGKKALGRLDKTLSYLLSRETEFVTLEQVARRLETSASNIAASRASPPKDS
jgi:peptidoglycan-N-acetylglucosamine deacetylase